MDESARNTDEVMKHRHTQTHKPGKVKGWYTICIEGDSIEFVLNDGNNNWDNAPIWYESKNYHISTSGMYSLLKGRITKLEKGFDDAFFLVVDLDGTLLGNDDAKTFFFDVWSRYCEPIGCVLGFNTGRHYDSVVRLVEKGIIGMPRVMALAVGTEIWWHHDDGTVVKDEGWEDHLRKSNFRAAVVRECAAPMIQQGLTEFGPHSELTEHKIVLYTNVRHVAVVANHLRENLAERGMDMLMFVSGWREIKYLDIINKDAGKLNSMRWMAEKLGFSRDRVVACGDSGNDIPMLNGDTEKAVVVGNAQTELLNWYHKEGPHGSRVVATMGTNAWGILEGLRHHGFLLFD